MWHARHHTLLVVQREVPALARIASGGAGDNSGGGGKCPEGPGRLDHLEGLELVLVELGADAARGGANAQHEGLVLLAVAQLGLAQPLQPGSWSSQCTEHTPHVFPM